MMLLACFLLLLSINQLLAQYSASNVNGGYSLFYECDCQGAFPCFCTQDNECSSDGTMNYTAVGNIHTFRNSFKVNSCIEGETCCRHILGYKEPEIQTTTTATPTSNISTPPSRIRCGMRGTRTRSNLKKMETEWGEFPWTLALFVQFGNEWRFYCGASLLSRNIALTAAHCVDRFARDVSKLRLRVGAWNLKDTMEDRQELGIAEVLIHEKFSREHGRFDIALLKTDGNVKPGKAVKTVCIPPKNLTLPEDANCIVTGWGRGRFGSTSKIRSEMKQVEQPIMPNKSCNQRLRNSKLGRSFRLTKEFTCAGGKTMSQSCQVLPGSPLVCEIPHIKRYFQVGIAWWHVDCKEKVLPNIYVKANHFVDWIAKSMKALL